MDKEIKIILSKALQNPKLKLLYLLIIMVTQSVLPLFFPLLKQAGFGNKNILQLSAHLLLLSLTIAIFYAIQWAIGRSSDLKCPYCGSYKFFLEESKTTGEGIKLGTGLVKRLYKCKSCGKSEKLFVKPISLNIASDDD